MTGPIRAWHGRGELKTAALAGLEGSGAVRAGGQGFLAGLTAPSLAAERGVQVSAVLADAGRINWLEESERLLGLSMVACAVVDRCFYLLPEPDGAVFAVAAVSAIPVGADLDNVAAQWMLDILADERNGVRGYAAAGSAQRNAVDGVIELFRRKVAGANPTESEWSEAGAVARRVSDSAPDAATKGPSSAAAAAANVAASAYAPDLIPPPIKMRALRAAAAFADVAVAAAFESRYLETEAVSQAAHIAGEAVRATADAAFHRVLDPVSHVAQRARAAERAGQSITAADAAVLDQVREAAEAAGATCLGYYRWRADRAGQLLAAAPTPPESD